MDALIRGARRDEWRVPPRYSERNAIARTALPLNPEFNYIYVYERGGYYRKKDEGGNIKYSSYMY